MTAVMIGGAGSMLSAGSAQAAQTITIPGGTICTFGGSTAVVAPACVFGATGAPGLPGPYLLNDKILTLISGPSGIGFIDFLTSSFPPSGPDNDTWNIKTNFSSPFGPQIGAPPLVGVFTYNLKIDQALEPFAYFKKVSLDSQHEGDNTLVTKDVYATLDDLNNSTNPIATLLSSDGSSDDYNFAFNTYKDLYIRDTYVPGENGLLTTLNNSFTQGDASIKVPGPLPLLGAGMALGFSRKLRSRIKGSVKA